LPYGNYAPAKKLSFHRSRLVKGALFGLSSIFWSFGYFGNKLFKTAIFRTTNKLKKNKKKEKIFGGKLLKLKFFLLLPHIYVHFSVCLRYNLVY